MPTPQEIHLTAWLMIPFVAASAGVIVKQLTKNVTIARVLLLTSCLLVLLAEVALICIFGFPKSIKVSTWIYLGGTSMHIARWFTRIFVCLRMAKLSPSPAMTVAFTNLMFVSIGFLIVILSNFLCYTTEWYETHTTAAPVLKKNLMSIVGITLTTFLFDVTSVYLHIKSLVKFGAKGITGLKLAVLSFSTFGSVVFGLGHSYGQIVEDSKTELFFVGIELAMLPSSIILGELIAIAIGKRLGKTFQSNSKRSGTESSKRGVLVSKASAVTSGVHEQKGTHPPGISKKSVVMDPTSSSPDNKV